MKIDHVTPIYETIYYGNNNYYEVAVIKAVVRINDSFEQEVTYTYNRNGHLIESIGRKHDIGYS